MSEPFVTVTKVLGKPVVQVRIGTEIVNYPLTRVGCLNAGRAIQASGAESWQNSSSVDFPQEVKPGCRLDVREIMSEGFQAAFNKVDRPRKTLLTKLFALGAGEAFQATLTPEEAEVFKFLKERHDQGEI